MSYVWIGPEVVETPLALVCDNEYHVLDVGAAVIPVEGVSHAHVYLNFSSGFVLDTETTIITTTCSLCKSVSQETKLVTKPGRVRIKMVREPWNGLPEDSTYYFDIQLDDAGRGWLETRAMFEMAEAGRPVHWEYRVMSAQSVTLSTRFIKYAVDLGEVNL